MEEKTAQPIKKATEPKKVETPVVADETPNGWMPRKTFALILILIVITVGLLVIALTPIINNRSKQTTNTLAYAQTQLTLSKPVSLGSNSYSTDVQITTGNKVTGADLEITYNPKIITGVDIKPGTFLTSPIVLFKKIDQTSGIISYTLGLNPGKKAPSGKGVIATITFSTVYGTTATQTPINFLPKTEITAVGYQQSVLKQSAGVLFQFATFPPPKK
jgi:hypothetical protein